MNKLPFPKIDPKVFDREGLKECYVFKPRKGEKNCPTVIHFVLVNINFRTFKAPGKTDVQNVCVEENYVFKPYDMLFFRRGTRSISSSKLHPGIQPYSVSSRQLMFIQKSGPWTK